MELNLKGVSLARSHDHNHVTLHALALTPKSPTGLHIPTVSTNLRARAGSLPDSLQDGINQLVKGSREIAHQMALMRSEINELRRTNKALTKRKSQKRKYIQLGGSLTSDEALQLIPQEVASAHKGSEESSDSIRPPPGQRRCKQCGKAGHNVRTCQIELLDSEESEEEDCL